MLYPCLTTLAVIVTANHFWLDGIVAAALLVLVMSIQALARRLLAARRGAVGAAGLQDAAAEAEPDAAARPPAGRTV